MSFLFHLGPVSWVYFDAQLNRHPDINPTVGPLSFDQIDCELTPNVFYWDSEHVNFDNLNSLDFNNDTIRDGI